jgi:hypothetical protein
MEKQQKLQLLKEEIERISKIIHGRGFKTKQQAIEYREQNLHYFKRHGELYDKIKELEWDLMSKEERLFEKYDVFTSKLKEFGKLHDFVVDLDKDGLWSTEYIKTPQDKRGVWLENYLVNKKSPAIIKWWAYYQEVKDKYRIFDKEGNEIIKTYKR